MVRRAHGFTIVELLIVIVVIGILAAITIVTYNGIQSRAYNTRLIANVKAYLNSINAYYAAHGVYPETTPGKNGERLTMVCIGTGYKNGTCGKVTYKQIYEDPLFTSEAAEFMGGNAGIPGDTYITVGGENFTGAVYGIDQNSTPPSYYGLSIQYALLGKNTPCILSGATSYNQGTNPATTACELILEMVPAR